MTTSNMRSYHLASALIFAVVALVQVYRASAGLPVNIGDFQVPVAFSWSAAIGAGAMAVWGWRLRDA